MIPEIPGLEQAIKRETAIRDQSFLELPEVIGGIDVQPLTLRHVLLLEGIGSPFICGGYVQPHDAAAFLLVVTGRPKGLKRWRLLRRVGGLNAKEAVGEIESYLSETFMDAPASSQSQATAYFSNAAALVDCFGSEYGWSEAAVLDIPLKRLFQYVKVITKRNNPKAILFNPSDKVKGRFLAELNKEQN